GCGTIVTTESCLLNPNRNPGSSRESVERYLADYCGASKVIWLNGGEIAGDDTDGHVDQLARFVNPTTIVAALEDDPNDENYAALTANFQRLQSMTDQDGRPLVVIALPMPRPLYFETHRLPASFLNFYIANGVVIVPTFDDPNDSVVMQTLANLFPDREIRGLSAVDLVWGLGAFHCLSQQEPEAMDRVR
ncbi:MAG: agmatine/peptidylarginine deiminase, partial [Planctomycetaceae bacterium]